MEEEDIEKLEAQARFYFLSYWRWRHLSTFDDVILRSVRWSRRKSADSDEIEVAGFKLKKDMIKFQSKLVKMHTVRIVFFTAVL